VRRLLPLLIALALPAACDSGGVGDEPARPAQAARTQPPPSITRAELGEHLAALQEIADRNAGNRAAGTPGYDASAAYVAERLRDAGWRVRRQPVPFTTFRLRRAALEVDGRALTRLDDFQVLSYSASGEAEGTLEAAESGCDAAAFAGIGAGEIPLVGRGDCFFREKARNAERAGARALVVVGEVLTPRGVPSGTLGGPGARIPVVLVSARALGDAGDGSSVRLGVDAVSRSGQTENVIAETPRGSGDGIVMAGGHLDSVADGPGINDNGSGIAALLEAAEAIGPRPPGARVRLGFWGAEELGLLGSRRYVSSLGRGERRRVRAYLNFDMVGSPNPVPELYADGDAELARVLRRAARPGGLGTVGAGGSSDHAPFEEAGIPVSGLYTGSTERGSGGSPRDPCYHLACDTLQNVDPRVLLRMAHVTADAVRTLSARHK
jgi:Zn-dependent M28 family amino/carboxypeptidase